MPRLFALLTGVKDYHPQSRVRSLTGCVNDVNNIATWLQKRFAANDLQIKKLLNEEATRQGVIDTFISHLINNPDIKPGNIVLFYYSGHGSFATSNPAFSEWDSEGKDETLVLYDSRCTGNFDLADKELRLLLSRIPAGASIVVIVDSCHSGSITRNINDLDQILLGQAKHQPARNNDSGRKLSDYLTINNNGYEQLLDGNGKAPLPPLRCLSLSACDRTEVAYESSQRPEGMFTAMLLEALHTGPVNINYARLYEQVYTLLKRKARQQTPQLEVSGGFDANTIVMDTITEKGDPVYEVVKDAEGTVTVNCGALHGIRNDAQSLRAMAVRLYDKDNPDATTQLVKISAVGLDKSELEPVTISSKILHATLLNLPPAVCIYVTGSAKQREAWQELLKQNKHDNDPKIQHVNPVKNETLAFVYDKDQYHDYELQIDADSMVLSQAATGKIIKTTQTADDAAFSYMLRCCNKICAWHQLLAMHNYAMSEGDFKETFQTEFGIELENKTTGEWELQPADSVLYLDEQNKKVPVRLRLTSTAADGWYCGVFYMNGRYGIEALTNPSAASKVSKDHPLAPFPKGTKLSLRDNIDESTDYIKLIISREPFKDFLIENFRGFEATNNEFMGERDFFPPEKIDQDWFVKTLSVKIVRRSGKIDGGTNFTNGKLTIHQHNSLSATASISPVSSHAKNSHPADQLQQYIQEMGGELLSLDPTKSVNPDSIVWVDAIEGDISSENPLQVTLQEPPEENERVLAMTMEDGFIQVIGVGVPDTTAGNYTVEIPLLPEDQQRQKNLARAAWFCFVKVVLRKDLSKLRKVIYKNGKVDYDAIPDGYIQPGMKIAVCIHGIIGDTKGMAAAMEFLQTDNNYHAVLAFDYENLNKEIDDIAETFKDLLQKAGVTSNTPVDIISHSMGGLVSRYMLEHIKGTEGWVNRLFMFGTPNGGSVLGSIPKIRDWTVTLLTLACNYGGALLGAAGPVLSVVNKVLAGTKVATNSLEQMAIGSKFLKLLKEFPSQPVTTQYHIIAGNVLTFVPPDDSKWLQKFMEKVKRQAGELLYGATTKNDIAVGIDSIFTLPAGINATKKEFPGHHLNYFELEDPINYFKTLLES